MKKLIFLSMVVLWVSAFYVTSYAAAPAAAMTKNSVTLDADLGSIIGASATGEFGWPVNVSVGGGYDFADGSGTGFINSNYTMKKAIDPLDVSIGAGYRYSNTSIGEAILGATYPLKDKWVVGAKTHLGYGSGFKWAAYATIGYPFDI